MHDKLSNKALEMAYRSMGEFVKHKYATALGLGRPTHRVSKQESTCRTSSSTPSSKENS